MGQGRVNVQSWVEGDTFATVVQWLIESKGHKPRSVSNVVELVFEELAAHVIEQGARVVDDPENVLREIALNRYDRSSIRTRISKQESEVHSPRRKYELPKLQPDDVAHDVRAVIERAQREGQQAEPEDDGDFDADALRASTTQDN